MHAWWINDGFDTLQGTLYTQNVLEAIMCRGINLNYPCIWHERWPAISASEKTCWEEPISPSQRSEFVHFVRRKWHLRDALWHLVKMPQYLWSQNITSTVKKILAWKYICIKRACLRKSFLPSSSGTTCSMLFCASWETGKKKFRFFAKL